MKNRTRAVVATIATVASLAVAAPNDRAAAFHDGNWISSTCINTTGWRNYSTAAKQANAAIDAAGETCYVGALATCQRANGGIRVYQSAGNTISQGVTTYDCDSNGTYNRALTNNSSRTSKSDFSSGCYSNC